MREEYIVFKTKLEVPVTPEITITSSMFSKIYLFNRNFDESNNITIVKINCLRFMTGLAN